MLSPADGKRLKRTGEGKFLRCALHPERRGARRAARLHDADHRLRHRPGGARAQLRTPRRHRPDRRRRARGSRAARARPGPGPRRCPGVNADHIAERTRVLLEAAAATSWAGHVASYLPGREQLLAAIAVYRDRYDVEHPSLLGPRPLEADAKRLATWTDLAHALSAERTDVPNEEPGNGGPDFDDWGPEETGPTGP